MRAPKPLITKSNLLWSVLAGMLLIPATQAAPLSISQVPLFVSTTEKANVLLILDNSNSMDEDETGQAVGGEDSRSKSEIARNVAENIVSTYLSKINLGLMAYKQNTPSSYFLHNSPYDVSYNPANYNSAYAGIRDSSTKKYRAVNPSNTSNYVYYNVALPFYASSNQGNAFCYSATADFDNGSETYPTGFVADNYRCLATKTTTSDTLPTPYGNAAAEAAAGYGGSLIYSGGFYPTDSDIAQNILDFGRFNTWSYVGTTWFNNGAPGRGYLHTPIKLLNSTQQTALNTKLSCNVPSQRTPTSSGVNTPACATCTSTCSVSGIKNAGLTPIEGTLNTASDYFSNNSAVWSVASEGYVAAAYPLPQSCGKDFVVFLTDGLPSTNASGVAVTNTATALAAAATAAGNLKANRLVETYMVGFAMPYGTSATQLDTIAAAGGTGTAYSASNTATLTTALSAIFSDILAKVGSASAVASNSTTLNTNSTIYQAKFNSANWSGELLAYAINATTGAISATPTWQGGTVSWTVGATVSTQTPSARNIFTYKPSTGGGVPFLWPANPAAPTSTEIDTTQVTALNTNISSVNDGLGSSRLDYLRGDSSNEGISTTSFRIRPANKLGDIINSTPAYVGKPDAGYPSSLESVIYATFRDAKASRTKMLYVGGNDGMLHGFDASSGKEILGYVPSKVYSNLSKLTSSGYSHSYFVDGTPTVADVFYNNAWHTVLVGSLAGGGQGVFALDITNPSTFAQNTTNAQNLVLWEFNDTDNAATTTSTDGDADLGSTFSQPGVARVCTARASGACTASKWVAIFGNGYNNTAADGSASTTGYAYLYVVDIQNGNILKKFDTKTGSTTTPNGLASPSLVDVDGDYYVDYVYAGDLQGNMWKFDLTGSIGAWSIAYGSGPSPDPLYQAKSPDGTVQPITTRPEVTTHPTGTGYLVLFGTGKYLEQVTDVNTTTAKTQSFYGIWDNNAQVTSVTTRNNSILRQQAVDAETSAWRHVTNNPINWSTDEGWYIDLCLNTAGSGACANNYGEKQVSNPVLINGRIFFTTLLPSTVSCTAGGSSWLMVLDFANGGQTLVSPFDTNADSSFNTSDTVAFGGTVGTATANGTKLSGGISSTPTFVYNPNATNKGTGINYGSGSAGTITDTLTNVGKGIGRVSWRELLNE